MSDLTQAEVMELFQYKDGNLYWNKAGRKVVVGNRAGTIDNRTGYRRLMIHRKSYQEHRIVFLYHYGYLPELIDHVDGNKGNNSIENLRPATKRTNGFNAKKRHSSKNEHKGVSWDSRRSKWIVGLYVEGKRKHIGYYDEHELACLVADEARDKYHGSFARNI